MDHPNYELAAQSPEPPPPPYGPSNHDQHPLPDKIGMVNFYDAALSLDLLALFVLSALTTPVATPNLLSRNEIAQAWILYGSRVFVFGYVLLLSCMPLCWRTRLNTQRSLILLVAWIVYAYRDVWPLATYIGQPLDASEGVILWVKLSLLTFAAIVFPLISPQRPPEVCPDQARPEQTASLLSLITYSWLNPLISVAQKVRHLPLEMLPPLAEYNSIQHLVDISYEHVDPVRTMDTRGRSRNVAWGLAWLFRSDLAIMGSMVVLASASSFLVPLGLKHILSYIERGAAGEKFKPWFWLLALLFGSMAVSMSMQFYHYVSTQVVARTQAILTQVMFDHALRMRSKADTSKGAEDKYAAAGAKTQAAKGGMPAITNLVTTDLTNVTNASTFVLLILLETPIQIVLSVYFLYSILGWSTFIGVAVMIALFPVPTELSKRTKDFQKAKAKATDQRVTLAMQMLDIIRTVKLLGWETEQSDKLEAARTEELKSIRKVTLMQIWISAINVCIPLLIMLASYATFTLVMKRDLSASIVFSSISLFEILRSQLNLIFFRVPILTNGKVSLDRINRFLQETELLDKFGSTDGSASSPQNRVSRSHKEIGISNARFTWVNDPAKGQGERPFFLNIDCELVFREGVLNVVHGPTASGKTSLLMALLGEMHYIPYGLHSFVSLPKDGGVAYAPQESWVLAATVKENILFGVEYEEGRYREVVSACALEEDIRSFPAGNDTMVGERGITLSGGQKARVTLARAVYSGAKVLLLDDVLSSLDNSTVRHIVTHCFHSKLLRDRTVILVTHNVEAVSPVAQWIVKLGHNGTVVDPGSFPRVDSPTLASSLLSDDTTIVRTAAADNQEAPERPTHKLFKDEEIEEGHVGWKPMRLLFGNMSTRPVAYWLAFLGALFLASGVLNAQIWLLGYWADQYLKRPSSQISVAFYLGVYTVLLFVSLITDAASRCLYMVGSLQASAVIHKKLIEAVLGTTLRWLDSTPTARVVARCTEDIGAIDGQISSFLMKLLELATSMFLRLILVVIVAPYFTIGVAFVGLIGGLVARSYMKAQLPVKREQSKMRAPLIGHMNATIAGLVSIRAYGAEESFRKDMYVRIDRWTRASNTFYNLNRWVIVRADLIGTIFTVTLATYLTYFTKLNASNVGFSLNMAIAFSSKVFELVRTVNTFEVAGNSLERIQQYLGIEQEDRFPAGSSEPDPSWPETGDLDVRDLDAWYSLDSPEVLKNVSFSVKSGERIGIVGRTGSGKSTLTLALLRCIPTNVHASLTSTAEVTYSGRSIASISLPVLRKSVTIIPQTPELFLGTVRQNLDPFYQYEEEELSDALLSAQGFDRSTQASVKEILQLETQVSSGGRNLSAGQRQIIALARAIVRKSKLLIMDEATSSIDHASDAMIQTALRQRLDADVTVLTVAHRLSTIKDYDKVLVLDSGKKVEFGKLSNLLLNEKSHFHALVKSAPPEERDAVYAAVGIPVAGNSA